MTTETATITETAPDGTETVIEITSTKPDDASLSANSEPSVVEEFIEALVGEDSDGDNSADLQDYAVVSDTDADADGYDLADSDTGDVETDTTEDSFDPAQPDTNVTEPDNYETTDADISGAMGTDFSAVSEPASLDTSYSADDASAASLITDPEVGDVINPNSTEDAGLEAHATAAEEAQQAADDFVASGDYAAAADARETAENEAYNAGDNNLLHGSDSTDLDNAGYQQQNAEYYEQQEATHAQQGDYAAAKEDASNAEYAVGNADFNAGGADHSGQAQAEQYEMGNAVWEQDTADYYAQSADQYAAQGDFDNAAHYAGEAVEHQDQADYYGGLGEHGSEMGVYDASSEVESGGSYDTSSVADYSSYEAPAADTSSVVDYSSHDTSTDYSTE